MKCVIKKLIVSVQNFWYAPCITIEYRYNYYYGYKETLAKFLRVLKMHVIYIAFKLITSTKPSGAESTLKVGVYFDIFPIFFANFSGVTKSRPIDPFLMWYIYF